TAKRLQHVQCCFSRAGDSAEHREHWSPLPCRAIETAFGEAARVFTRRSRSETRGSRLLGEVDVRIWDSFRELQRGQRATGRYFFLTTKSTRPYYDVDFRDGDFLVFGRETKGLPETLLA